MKHLHDNYYDIIIAGGGIAGLTTAEIFARSGYKVLIIEKEDKLCSNSSGKQHGWFHLGSLYSVHRDANHLKILLENCDYLLNYYRDFNGMNIKINPENGNIYTEIDKEVKTPWFNDEQSRLVYFVEQNLTESDQKDFKDYHKISWEVATKLFLARHNRFIKYDWRRGAASKFITSASFNDYPTPEELKELEVQDPILSKISFNTSNYKQILGFDRSMNVRYIIG